MGAKRRQFTRVGQLAQVVTWEAMGRLQGCVGQGGNADQVAMDLFHLPSLLAGAVLSGITGYLIWRIASPVKTLHDEVRAFIATLLELVYADPGEYAAYAKRIREHNGRMLAALWTVPRWTVVFRFVTGLPSHSIVRDIDFMLAEGELIRCLLNGRIDAYRVKCEAEWMAEVLQFNRWMPRLFRVSLFWTVSRFDLMDTSVAG